MAYSFYLKRVAVIDVLLLSALYTLRMLAGGAATGTEISHWLGGFSTFLFLSLAMVKRFSELENLRERGAVAIHGRGYLVSDLEQIRTFGTASAYAAVVVFMLYIARPDVTELYGHAGRLWLIVPLLLYWLTRIWLLASRGELDDDPVIFALTRYHEPAGGSGRADRHLARHVIRRLRTAHELFRLSNLDPLEAACIAGRQAAKTASFLLAPAS